MAEHDVERIKLPNGDILHIVDATGAGRIVPAGTTVEYDNVTYTVGDGCEIFNDLSHNIAVGDYAHAEGSRTGALGDCSHSEGIGTLASGDHSHAEGGFNTCASGLCSHAEGLDATASGEASHAEGFQTVASDDESHAEGRHTTASGIASHAEGWSTTASGDHAHAEGDSTTASGQCSHSGGFGTIAASDNQTVIGSYNISDSNETYAFIIGNGGWDDENKVYVRSNAFVIDWSGLIYVGNSATGVNVSTIVNHITIDDVFGRGTRIASGSDMDSATYRTPGRYYVNSGSDAATINGCPNTSAGGQLTVSYVINGNNTNVLQEYILRTGTAAGITYKRIYYSGAWGEWKEYKSVTDFYSGSKALTPGSGETIDLNDIGPGRFRVSSTSYTSQILNAPSDFTSSTLYFIESGMTVDSTNYMYQIIYPVADASTVYKRHCVAGTWSDWITFKSLTESEKNAIPALVNEYKNLANPLDARGYMVQGTSFPYTKGGVTYTLNTDGSITVTGTASSTTVMRIPVTLEIGKTYVISGCPATGSSDTFSVQLRPAGGNDLLAADYGSGASYTTTTQTDYDLCLRFQSGLVTGGRIFRPMVCLSDKWDVSKSFAPYKKSTVEITDELVALIDNSPKNIVNNKLTTKTARGVTATTNADGSITITGADSDKTGESFVLVHDLSKPSATTAFTTWNKADKTKTYVCPTVGDSRVRFQVITYESSSTYTTTASSDSNIVFTVPSNRTYISFRIWIADSADFTSSPVTFYPMVCEKYMWDISTAFVPYKPVTESYTCSLSSTYVDTSSSSFTIYKYGPLCVARVLFVVTGTLTGSDKVSSSNIPGRFRPIATTLQAMTARNADNWTTATVNSVSVQVNTSGEIRLLSGANSSSTVYVNGTMTWMVTTPQ